MTDPVFDHPFVWLPSAVLGAEADARGDLFEGKALGTAKEIDLVLLTDPTMLATMDPAGYAKERKSGVTVGKRKLDAVMNTTEAALADLIRQFEGGSIDAKALRKEATLLMKRAWRDVFIAGVRAGGQPPTKTLGVLAKVSPVDEKWLAGAVKHEMTFLNRFLADVVAGKGKMPYLRRASMYVRALTSFYESARVIALPANSLIYGKGPNDKRTCPSCSYMFAHNPFTKKTLPTTPRSGLTICLTNCRDRLLIRRVAPEEVIAAQEAGLSRGTHVRNLRRVKRDGHL